MNKQSGQTLIETLVACFILVMGISAALGLANYSLNATTNIKQQTVALGLAREGIEVVKNIRDTNWLKATLTADCYNFLPGGGTNNAYCYQDWLSPASGTGQNISAPTGTRGFALRFDSSQSNPWVLAQTESDFGLNKVDINSGGSGVSKVYYEAQDGLTFSEGNSGFGRAIYITQDNSFAPFNQNTGPRLKISSIVWWKGKNCPESETPPSDHRCAVSLETYLTNWRNF